MTKRQGGRGLTFQQLKELISEKTEDVSLGTIESVLKRKTSSYYRTIKVLFDALDISFGAKDIIKSSDLSHDSCKEPAVASSHQLQEGAIMSPETLKLWIESEQRGEVATIHSVQKGRYPVPYLFSTKSNLGLPRTRLGDLGAIGVMGAWHGKEDLLYGYQEELLNSPNGCLTDHVTCGSEWVECEEKDALPVDSPEWVAIATPPNQFPSNFIAWGQDSMAWLRTEEGYFRTRPEAQFLTREARLIDINGVPYRFSRGVEKIA